MKLRFKDYLFGFICGIVLMLTVSYSAAIYYKANEIEFTPTDTSWNATTVEDAINDIYNEVNDYDFITKSIYNLDNANNISISNFRNYESFTIDDNFMIGITNISSGQTYYKHSSNLPWSNSSVSTFSIDAQISSNKKIFSYNNGNIILRTCISSSSSSYCADNSTVLNKDIFAYIVPDGIGDYETEIISDNKLKKYDVYKLGNGTSFDLSSYSNYQNLTEENFLVGFSSIPEIRSNFGNGKSYYYSSSSFSGISLKKSYDNTSGILTISGNNYRLNCCITNTAANYCSDSYKTGSVTPYVYLIKDSMLLE